MNQIVFPRFDFISKRLSRSPRKRRWEMLSIHSPYFHSLISLNGNLFTNGNHGFQLILSPLAITLPLSIMAILYKFSTFLHIMRGVDYGSPFLIQSLIPSRILFLLWGLLLQ